MLPTYQLFKEVQLILPKELEPVFFLFFQGFDFNSSTSKKASSSGPCANSTKIQFQFWKLILIWGSDSY